MNNRPDENILISWLYGELDEVEKAKVDKYFQENPDELKKMQQLKDVRNIMGSIRDKEIIAPPLFMDDVQTNGSTPFWRSNSFKTIMSIAASFLVLIVAAKLMNMEISYSNSELRISFGKKTVEEVNGGLTAMQVQQMIDQSNAKNQEAFDSAIKQAVEDNTSHINELAKKTSSESEAQIRNFVATLQRENLTQIRDFLQLSTAEQRKYTDNLLVDFAKYLQEQRTQDLNMFQTRFSRLEQNTDQLKSETEQILASIISNSPQVQQSSY
jgi:hypothetical protein